MKHSTPTKIRSIKGFFATLISLIIFTAPLAPVTFAASRASTTAVSPGVVKEARTADDGHAATNGAHATVVNLVNPVAPLQGSPVITATKVDTFPDTDGDGKAVPGEEITYNVTITNSGTAAATGVMFNDTPDANTTLVAGSVQTQPVAFNDTYSAFGNVRIQQAAAAGLLANDRDPDVGNGTSSGLTASGPTTSSNGGNVVINSDGSFSYNPAPGYTGNDTFTYTATDASGKTDTATVQITVGPTLVWFINNDPATPAGNDGRITSPFNSIASYNASAPTKDPNDIIFIYQGTAAYTGNVTLTNGMKLIGQGFALQTETGAPPAGSDPLPGATASPTINSTAGNTITLGQNNTIRGVILNNSAGIDIIGNAFGTLTTSVLTISGTGRPLSLTNGTLASTIDAITSTSSTGGQGILLSSVAGSLSVPGGTSISGATTQGILVTDSTVTASFGNTTVSGGTDGVSLQNNASGTRTFGTLSISGNTADGFLHGAGGGTTNVTGATNITNPGGTGINIQNSNAAITFAATTVGKNNAGTAVNLATNGSNSTSFSSLTITASVGAGLVTSAGGSLTVTTGSITGTGTGVTASLTNTTLNLTFTSVSSNGGANGLIISGGSGSFTSGTTTLQNNAGIGLLMSSSAVAASFGNTTVTSSAGDGVDLSSNTGAITFADLDITPDAGLRGLDAQNNTNTLTVTSGDITTSGGATASAVFIDGPVGRTAINITFTSITTSGVTNSINLADVSGTKFQVTGTTQINTRAGTGVLIDNSTATTIQFATTNIPNASAAGGYGIRVEDSSSAVTVATATISDANLTSGQADGNSDLVPDSDGDGDAIFLNNNTGSFTLNGGTLSNCGNDCIDVRNSNNLVLSGVTINTPGVDVAGGSGSGTGGHGIQAIDLKGTSSITGSTITNFDTAARDGARFINSGATTLTLTIASTTFSNSSGSNGVLISGRGTSVVNTTINSSCVFSALSGAAITHNAGDTAGSTATSNITVQNNTFQNAPTNGLNTVSARSIEAGKATVNISNNTFTNVAQTASSNTGAITVNGDGTLDGNLLSVTIQNNTMSGLGNATSACGGGATPCDGYRAIQVFIDDQADVSGNILIDGNIVTNVRRDGLWLDIGRGANGNNVNARVTNNTFGTAAAPVGQVNQSGMSIFSRCFAPGGVFTACGKTDNVLVSGNTVTNNSTGALSNAATVFARAEDNANLQITVTGNTIRNLGALEEFRARSAFPISAAVQPVLCLDMNGNQLNSGAGLIVLTESADTTMNVEQASLAALAASNGIPAGNATVTAGSPTFGVACATPPTRPEDDVTLGGEEASNHAAPLNELNPTTGAAADTTTTTNGDDTLQTAAFSNVGFTTDDASADNATDNAVYFGSLGAATRRNVSYTRARYNALEGDAVYGREQRSNDAAVETAAHVNREATTRASNKVMPVAARAALVQGGSVSVNIGTLNPGDSVTITFRVTVNDPLPGGTTQVSNQGQVTGSNFPPPTTVNTDDPSTGAANDPTVTPIQPPPDIFIRDGSVAEPATGSAPMTFSVVLSLPTTNSVSVNFTTTNGGANPATAGSDYTTTSGTLTFAPGERVQTISVPVLADVDNSETDETFLVDLSTPLNANIGDGQAVGTIKPTSDAGTTIISELRTSGPGSTGTGDANDEFVEIYNNTDSSTTVSTTDGSSGWALVKSGATCGSTPVIVGVIPNGTVIPARGHYLFVGSGYSLGGYASGNLTMTSGIEDDRNVALFNTSNLINIGSTTRLDAVGFDLNTGNNCDLLREGTNLAAALGSTTQYSFVRKVSLVNGRPIDANNSLTDFIVVSTTGAAVGNNPTPVLGAPGPENLASPIVRNIPAFTSQLLDPTVGDSVAPNREKSFVGVTNGPQGTLTIRRTFINNTGGNVTQLRFRIIDITTLNSPNVFGGAGQSDLRALNSTDGTATGPSIGTVSVRGTTIDTPPAQPNGGGVNSSYSLTTPGVITLGTPLPPGGSVNVQFVLGIMTGGKFNFFINIEALP